MNAGDTFLFVGCADNHLWMVISDPLQNEQEVLIVHFSTWNDCWDQACIVEAHEHPFLNRKTIVAYEKAVAPPLATLEAVWQDGRLKFREPLSPELLEKIRQCARHSRIKRDFRDLLIAQSLLSAT